MNNKASEYLGVVMVIFQMIFIFVVGYRYTSETFSAKYYPGRKSTYT